MRMSCLILSCLIAIVLVSGCNQEAVPSTASPESAVNQKTAFQWEESTPQEQGIDEKLLEQVDAQLKTNHTKIKSLLIVKNGHIVYEKYRSKSNKETPTAVFSVTKSVVSALTGIALDKELLKGTNQKLSEWLPELMSKQTDPEKKEITILNALTMTGGLNSVDVDINAWFNSEDWLTDALDQPMVDPSRSEFIYNTGLTHLLSGALTKAVGMSTKEFADEHLFGPMDITNYRWLQDPQGVTVGGTNLFLLPRDMAKFGYLYLHHGMWGDQQLIPKEWVISSIEKHVELENNVNYGYLFWLTTMKGSQGKEIFTYEANGYGGQHIRVIPALNTIIVVTSDENSREQSDANELVEKYIIPALG